MTAEPRPDAYIYYDDEHGKHRMRRRKTRPDAEPLYRHPTPYYLGGTNEAEAILAWLETKNVEVRTPLRYGSRGEFLTGPIIDEDGIEDDQPSNLRQMVLNAIRREKEDGKTA
jgi:hypothetical protein